MVLASRGYPEKYKTGFKINGINSLKNSAVDIYHAGTKIDNKKNFITNGGRVLNLVVKNNSLEKARVKIYNFIQKIKCSNLFCRKDIGN